MKEILADIKAKLENGDFTNEEHVRLCIVARVLQALEWNIWDPNEVNAEFLTVPDEDKTKVDLALFLKPFVPSVFIETKAVGQMQSKLSDIERQVRDYNRNNTALFSIITDGRIWRFYYSQTGGEFAQKFFKSFDMLKDSLEGVEHSCLTFLKKSAVANDSARLEAENYLRLSQKQRTMEDCLPEAKRLIYEAPYPSLPEALTKLVSAKGFCITPADAVAFIKEASTRTSPGPSTRSEPFVAATPDTEERRDHRNARRGGTAHVLKGVHELFLKAKGFKARGYYESPKQFVVYAGSESPKKATKAIPPSYGDLREGLIKRGILREAEDRCLLTEDYVFKSPSSAASVMLARSANGLTEWKDRSGRTLKEIRKPDGA